MNNNLTDNHLIHNAQNYAQNNLLYFFNIYFNLLLEKST